MNSVHEVLEDGVQKVWVTTIEGNSVYFGNQDKWKDEDAYIGKFTYYYENGVMQSMYNYNRNITTVSGNEYYKEIMSYGLNSLED